MTTFVSRLASMALGQRAPGAAHVMLPPRFAPAPAISSMAPAPWPTFDDPADADEAMPPRHFPPQPPDEHQDDKPRIPARSVTAPVARPAATPGKTTPAPSPGAPFSPPAAKPEPGETRAARGDDIALSPPVRIIAPPVRSDATPTITTPPQPPLAPPPRSDAAPLSESAVAARIAAPADAAPVIHVTIDRIDVRAPQAERPAPSPKAARRQPAVSLGDYLRNGGGGGRA